MIFMRQLTTCLLSLVAAATLLVGAPGALAEAVDGTWVSVINQGDGPIHDPDTDHPIVGEQVEDPDTSLNFADGEMIQSPFTPITLTNTGDKIVFTGTVDLEGTINSPLSSGTPRTQFRFGLFDGDADPPDDTGWVGYFMHNKHGNAGSPQGVLAVKPVGNTSAPLSVTGQTTLQAQQGDGTAASLFNDGNYNMMLSIERNAAGELLLNSSIIGFGFRNDGVTPNEFSQIMSGTHTTASTTGTYVFDRLSFLMGGNLDTDRAAFSALDVTFMPGGPAGQPGDFNNDGKADAADYVIWRQNETANNPLPNDNGLATQAERFDLWRMNFGEMAGSGSGVSAIPEPATPTLLAFAALVGACCRPRKRPVRFLE
jgi:hypothetical protein